MSAQLGHEDSSTPEATPPPLALPRRLYWSPRMMCLTAKPVIVILLWVFVAACVFQGLQYTSVFAIIKSTKNYHLAYMYAICCYAFMTSVVLSYPIGGFLADVYCGRYKMVAISLAFIWTAMLLLGVALIVTAVTDHFFKHSHTTLKNSLDYVTYICLLLSFVAVIPGLSGFYSNVVQLSLDQLRDAPSHVLGIFLHWYAWVDLFGESAVFVLYIVFAGCSRFKDSSDDIIKNAGYVLTCVMSVLLSVLLVLNRFTKHWFYAADIHYNPYKTVVNVLKYVRAHKYPTYHSAMHWTNGEQPSRFDFAKECYGGPFTSSQVEDVKTLGRVVIVLLAVGPVFVLCVPTSYLIFPMFSFHTVTNRSCSLQSIVVETGVLGQLLSLVSLPVITWVVYCVLKNRVPKILTRLEVGIILFIIGVLSMLLIDLVGHLTKDKTNSFHCLFLENYGIGEKKISPYFGFGFPWYVLIIPNCFSVISYSLIVVTVLEFISAQAPQPMKGLVFGVFFATKGVFILFAAGLLVPFSFPGTTNFLSPYVSCGTSYFFLTLAVSLVGLVLFACASRWYKYRMRDEEPFTQFVVEEIFERRLQHNAEGSLLESPDVVPGCSERRSSAPVRRALRVTESEERVRASEWFEERELRGGEPGRLLSLSHDWYGTFQYNDSERSNR